MTTPTDNPQEPKPRRSRLAMASLALALSPIPSLLMLSICQQFVVSETLSRAFGIIAVVAFLASPILAIASFVVIYKSHGRLTGYRIAVIGITIMALSTAIICGSGSRVPKGSQLYERVTNADVVIDALRRYEHEHGQLPPRLSSLVPEYLNLNKAGALFGPINYPHFVQSEFRRTVRSVEDAKAADEHGPYVYLGFTNHSSQIIMFERPSAWKPYSTSSMEHRNVWVIRRDYIGTMVTEERLKEWGIWPLQGESAHRESNTVSRTHQ